MPSKFLTRHPKMRKFPHNLPNKASLYKSSGSTIQHKSHSNLKNISFHSLQKKNQVCAVSASQIFKFSSYSHVRVRLKVHGMIISINISMEFHCIAKKYFIWVFLVIEIRMSRLFIVNWMCTDVATFEIEEINKRLWNVMKQNWIMENLIDLFSFGET